MLSQQLLPSRLRSFALSCLVAIVAAGAYAGDVVELQPKAGDRLNGLTTSQQVEFGLGLNQYQRTINAPDGLGPIYNQFSCAACHNAPVGGGGTEVVTRFGRIDDGVFDPLEEFGGTILHALFLPGGCEDEVPPEANHVTQRITNGSLGYGLVEAIPDADILALESPGPGVSGRTHMVEPVEDPGNMRVGRFGWKAQIATILHFSADAALHEIGITNRFFPDEVEPNGILPPDAASCDNVADPEDNALFGNGKEYIDRVTDYQRLLAAPPQTPKSGMTGEAIFVSTGCAECHTPHFTTADDPSLPDAIRNQEIRPYSDFLLHDMGDAADFIEQGDASMTELRTPPLWGLAFREALWHDGRFAGGTFANRVTLAIEKHGSAGSEGLGSATNWAALTESEKAEVIRFLESLGRAEFDFDGDNVIDESDFLDFADCFFAAATVTPDDDCAIADIDQDGDVDMDDYSMFLLAYEGEELDCNENQTLDLTDIITSASADVNRNAIPDDCENLCTSDIFQDNVVDTFDLLELLSQWGACPDPCGPDCTADIFQDCTVDTFDLLQMLEDWGDC